MKQDYLSDLSMQFGIAIYQLARNLQDAKEFIISNQIGRSGTSIGANIREAQYAASKADFVNKMTIALKEANETSYWLDMLVKLKLIEDSEYKQLEQQCTRLRVSLIKTIKTTKENL